MLHASNTPTYLCFRLNILFISGLHEKNAHLDYRDYLELLEGGGVGFIDCQDLYPFVQQHGLHGFWQY